MDSLPDDVARVVEELLGAKEIGALGCASKRWRPDHMTWERVAKRDPLTHCPVVPRRALTHPPQWSRWCKALCSLRTLDADRVGNGFEENKIFVLQIWRGDKLLATSTWISSRTRAITETGPMHGITCQLFVLARIICTWAMISPRAGIAEKWRPAKRSRIPWASESA